MQVGTTNINLYHASIYARYDAHLTYKQHTLYDIQTVIKRDTIQLIGDVHNQRVPF